MGACSSKPKTTEFEGSTEPSKKTEDVGADRSIDAVAAAQVSHQNEPGKEDQGAADAGAGAVQETRSLIASKDEEPLIKESVSTAEGVSYSVESVSSLVDGEAGDSAAEKVKAAVGETPKIDVGDGVADYKEVSEKATSVDDGVGGDQEKLFEDKAVVLDEASNAVLGKGDAYIDKAVAADEEKAHESSDKGCGSVPVQDEESMNLQDITKAPGVESPILGVVHFAEPIHVDDVSESVGSATSETTAHADSKVSESPNDASESFGSAMPETTAHTDSTVSESQDEIERDVLTSPNIGEDVIPPTEEVANLSSGSPQEAPVEKEEVLHDDSKGSPILVSVLDDGVGPESRVDDARSEEVPLESADAQDETSVEDPTKPETIEDPQNGLEEIRSEPHEESSLEESARESHPEVTENEDNAGNLDEPGPEAPKVHESIDGETSIEPKAETTLEKAIEGQCEGVVDEPDVQPQALAIEEPAEDGKPEATPDEASAEPSVETDREEKVEKLKVESVDTGNLESSIEQVIKVSGEGDLAFEDASDVPLKVESSTIDSGDKPNS